MRTQSDTFFSGEGTAWLKRNENSVPIKDDLVLGAFDLLVGSLDESTNVLEIGCSDGWRLKEIKKRYSTPHISGIDPSALGIAQAKEKGINAVRGFAESLPFSTGIFDVVIYGFCLYLCDRDNLFSIVAEGDRVLADGGLMVVYDFVSAMPCKNLYKHKDGVWSYKQDYEKLFLANPAYTRLIENYHKDGQTKASILRKSLERGWPSCE